MARDRFGHIPVATLSKRAMIKGPLHADDAAPAGRGKWAKKKESPNPLSADRRARRRSSPRPPFRASSVLSFRPCRIATVRTQLGLVGDHDQPAPAAARAALGLLERRRG
jgi:hypothetical protein